MARTPVTRVQLDAYRFGQRRMESALARRDPVLLHEELRGQRRVVATGLAVAMLGLVAAFGYAKLVPQPRWESATVVAGAQSGRLFAVVRLLDRPVLVPVANLAAARLVLWAATHGADASGGSDTATATPVTMDDRDLDAAPRTASAAVPGAAAILPAGEGAAGEPRPGGGPWAVCGATGPDGRPGTTLIAGATGSTPLGRAGGLLLAGPDRTRYLVVGGHKHRIDDPEVVLGAYDLRDHVPRPVGAALLAAIPDGARLDALELAGAGRPAPALPGHSVGDVVRVVTPGRPDRLYLVLAGGVQEISGPVAALIRAGQRADTSTPPDAVRLEQVNTVERVAIPVLADYPDRVPVLPETDPDAVCWQWSANGLGGTVTTAAALPVPAGRSITRLAQAGRPGAILDAVSLPADGALVACPVTADTPHCGDRPAATEGSGWWLVSETGVGYPIARGDTAAALGATAAVAVPADALRALPPGPTLDLAQADRAVDVLTPPASG